MRTVLALAFGIGMTTALTGRAADDTPTADEQKVIDAVRVLKGKASIDSGLHPEARVAVKFEAATDATLVALAKRPQVGAIQALDGRQCTGKGFAALADLPHLRRLVLNQSRATDKGLAVLAGCKQLRTLIIPESVVTDDGLAALEKMTRLEALDLSETKVTDKGIAHIKRLERLEILHLNKTGITDKGLFELKPLEGLRSLSVGGSKVTAAAADKFPDEMPNLRVVRR
ncbi:MAG: hypothetical protein JWO38_1407 [Gemmataceae bacterium]|nr:hypothetical protein [Gemmataceae bacterium]